MDRHVKSGCTCCVWILFLALGLIWSVGCSASEEPQEPTTSTSTTLDEGLDYTLTFSSYLPNSASVYETFLIPWTKAVSKAAEGRVDFEMTEPGGLPKDMSATLDDVLAGSTDLTVFTAVWTPGEFPLLELASLPVLFPDIQTAARVVLQLIEEYGCDEYEGLRVLGFMASGLCQYGGLVSVRDPADLRGLAIRVASDVEYDIVTALGATPVDVRPGYGGAAPIVAWEFDGLLLPWSFLAANTDSWSAPYWTECDLYVYKPYLLVMNQDKWDSLPASVQKAFNDNSGGRISARYLADEIRYAFDNSLVPALRDRGYDYQAISERALAEGHPVHVLTEAERVEWREAMQPVWQVWVDRYADRLPTQEILDRALELVELETQLAPIRDILMRCVSW